MDESIWDERYRSHSHLWSGNPNPHLVSETSALTAGKALDVGCGEGADAIWLADHGWQVTAVDISSVALQRGAARAAEVGADIAQRIDWIHADLTTWHPDLTFYDLLSAHFLHLPREPRDSIFRRLFSSVAPGGTLLIVGHHPSDLQTTIPRPRTPDVLFTSAEVATLLDQQEWNIIVNEERDRFATDSEGQTVTIHDTVLRAQRRN